jgi:hypothetical protein
MNETITETNARCELLFRLLGRLDEQIRIELDLIGQRMNLLAVSQAFLFAAYTTDLLVLDPYKHLRNFLLWGLPALGLGICTIVFLSLCAAIHVVHQRKCERETIRDRLRDDLEGTLLPPSVFGSRRLVILDHVSPDKWQHACGNYPSIFLGPFIATVWIILLSTSKN